jgi:two-component system response regulator YesN
MASNVFVLLIPILIGIIAYSATINVISDEVNKVHNTSLREVKTFIDSELQMIAAAGREISLNVGARGIAIKEGPLNSNDYNNIRILQRELGVLTQTNTFIEEIYIYFKKHNLLITDNQVYGEDIFETIAQERFGMDYDSWRDLVNSLEEQNFTIGRRVLDKKGIFVNKVIFRQSMPAFNFRNPEATIFITVDGTKIKQLFRNLQWTSQGSVFAIDSRNQFIDSGIFFELSSLIDYDSLVNSDAIFYKDLYNETLAVNHVKSDVADWEYGSIIPMEIFLEKVNYIRTIIIIYVALCFIIGGIIVYSITRRNYSPLIRIMQLFGEIADRPADKTEEAPKNEFKFIESSINRLINEKETFQNKLRQQNEALRYNFLTRMMKRRIWSYSTIDNAFESYGITFKSDDFMVMTFTIDDLSRLFFDENAEDTEENMQLIYIMVKNVSKELIGEKHLGYFCETDGMMTCLINIIGRKGKENDDALINEILQIAQRIKEFFKENFALYLSVAVSDIHSGYSGISTAYTETVEIIEYKTLVDETDTVIHYSTIRPDEKWEEQDFGMLQKERKFMNCIAAEDYNSAHYILNDIIENDFSRSIHSLQIAKCRIFGLVNSMLNAVGEIKTTVDIEFFEELDPVNRLLNSKTLVELQKQVNFIFDSINRYYTSKNKDAAKELMDSALSFIQDNFAQPDLSVSSISEKFNVSVSYLSRIFKKQTGLGVLDYIHKIRLEEAKKLLKDSSLNVKDIADRVGYYNTVTMTRAFRKYEGVTPGKFREIV